MYIRQAMFQADVICVTLFLIYPSHLAAVTSCNLNTTSVTYIHYLLSESLSLSFLSFFNLVRNFVPVMGTPVSLGLVSPSVVVFLFECDRVL